MTEPLVIRGTSIAPGESALVKLDIARLPIGVLIHVPVHVFRGKKPGPTLLLQGGLHGDELNGIEICRRLVRRRLVRPTRGTVLVVPLLNVYGFLHIQREMPDGKDINRMFPGTRAGSFASRMVHQYMSDLFPHVDYAIDYHTGGKSRANYPQIRYTREMPRSRALAEAFAAPFVMSTPLIAKSLRQAAYKRSVPVIVYEGGESLRLDEHAIEEGVNGALRVMAHLGMVSRRKRVPEPGPSVHLGELQWIRARRAGLFRAVVGNGQHVAPEEALGYVTDPFGQYTRPLKAHREGYVITVNYMPVVNQGDPLVRLGFPGERADTVEDE